MRDISQPGRDSQISIVLLALSFITVPVAQWIARWTSNPKVPGSNPGRDANFYSLA